jgi:hypothetical protein
VVRKPWENAVPMRMRIINIHGQGKGHASVAFFTVQSPVEAAANLTEVFFCALFWFARGLHFYSAYPRACQEPLVSGP